MSSFFGLTLNVAVVQGNQTALPEQRYQNNHNHDNHHHYYHLQAPDGIIRKSRQNSVTLGSQQWHRSEVLRHLLF